MNFVLQLQFQWKYHHISSTHQSFLITCRYLTSWHYRTKYHARMLWSSIDLKLPICNISEKAELWLASLLLYSITALHAVFHQASGLYWDIASVITSSPTSAFSISVSCSMVSIMSTSASNSKLDILHSKQLVGLDALLNY